MPERQTSVVSHTFLVTQRQTSNYFPIFKITFIPKILISIYPYVLGLSGESMDSKDNLKSEVIDNRIIYQMPQGVVYASNNSSDDGSNNNNAKTKADNNELESGTLLHSNFFLLTC